jgi:hypothetical protein
VDTGKLTLFGQLVVHGPHPDRRTGSLPSPSALPYLRLGVGMRGRWIIEETLLHTPVSR